MIFTKLSRLLAILTFMALPLPTQIVAQNLQKGIDAAERGDYIAALSELEPLADQGVVEAQFNSALIYMHLFNFDKAEKLLRMADKLNHPDASYFLGLIYRNGLNGDHDPKKAADWFFRSAMFDYPDAHYMLHIAYDQGMGELEMDPEAAFMYAVSAAMLGHADAQYKLGLLYGTGETVEQDLILAHMWLEIAAFSDTFGLVSDIRQSELSISTKDNVKIVLDSLVENLTLQQVLEAKSKARKCFASSYSECNSQH
tara:strand:+ start:818 stop:1585 length:768 start_codon:yes stop_codon:yes gene_type:complete